MKVTHKDSFSFWEGGQVLIPPGNFNFGPFIRRTLVESGTVFAQT